MFALLFVACAVALRGIAAGGNFMLNLAGALADIAGKVVIDEGHGEVSASMTLGASAESLRRMARWRLRTEAQLQAVGAQHRMAAM